jgi:3-oxoacyl-[acyl-carrier-protein] synthase III
MLGERTPSLESLTCVLPHRRLTRASLAYLDAVTPEDRRMMCGAGAPDDVRRATSEDATEQLSVAVARTALDEANRKPDEIDYFITCEIGATGQPLATLFVDELGVPSTTPVQSIQNGTAGMLDGLALAATMIASGQRQRVLIVATSVWDIRGEGLADPTDPSYRLFGDAACAAVVSDEGAVAEMIAHETFTDGSIYAEFGARLRDRRNPMLSSFAPTGSLQVRRGAYIDLSDAAVKWFENAGDVVIHPLVERILKGSGVNARDVSHVCLQPFGTASEKWRPALRKLLPGVQLHDVYPTTGWTGAPGPLLPLIELRHKVGADVYLLCLAIAEGGQASALLFRSGSRFKRSG